MVNIFLLNLIKVPHILKMPRDLVTPVGIMWMINNWVGVSIWWNQVFISRHLIIVLTA